MLEWGFTALFTLEYLARIACVRHPWHYMRSFWGAIDLLSVLPTYLAMAFPGIHLLVDVRVLRLLRIFRVFKLTAYVSEYQMLGRALSASRRKIMIFLSVVVLVVLIIGTLMYVVEGPAQRLHQHPHRGLLGHHHHDRGLWRHHAAPTSALHLLGHDAPWAGARWPCPPAS